MKNEQLNIMLEKAKSGKQFTDEEIYQLMSRLEKLQEAREKLEAINKAQKEKLNALNAHMDIQAQKLSEMYGLTVEEVKELIDKYHKHKWTAQLFSLLVVWHNVKKRFKNARN